AWMLVGSETEPSDTQSPLAQPEQADSTACDLMTKQPSPHHHNLPWHEGLARSCHLAPLGQVGAARKPSDTQSPLAQPEQADSTACDLMTKQPSPHHHNLPWHEGLARSCHLAPLGQVGAERKPSDTHSPLPQPPPPRSSARDLMTKQPSPHHHNLPWHEGLARSCH